ncbi:MAG: cytochrome C [Myxococcales bacterium]|nr:cytochrome C [Myxococcales bacterium]
MELFGATVTSYAVMDGDDVSRLVTNIPVRAFENAPPQAASGPLIPALVLVFPERAGRASFVQHLELFWEVQGHPPPVYQTPHFDFHYYRMTPSEVAAIDCLEKTPVPSRRLPQGYVPPPPTAPDACIPGMGFHAAPEADLAMGARFDATLILGYYGGDLTFLEPMITRETLLARRSFEMAIPLPPEIGTESRLPTLFSVDYRPEMDAYDFILAEFQRVSGPLQ